MTALDLAPDGRSRRRYARRRRLLAIGALAPAVALASVLAAMAAYPGFNNARQYLSELGGATAALPQVFNAGVLVAGAMAALAGIGFGLAVAALGRAPILGGFTAAAFLVAGAGLVTASIFPWPDPRHLAVNLGLGIQLAPLLLLAGLRRCSMPRLKVFLAVVSLAMAVLMVLTKHLVFAGLVNDANVGWWERAYATVLVGWVAVAALALERRLHLEASQAQLA